MWIGFSAVEGTEAGTLSQGEAFSLESCQNWLPGEPHPATAERCVRLGPAGQCNTDLCSASHSYVCELRPGGALGLLGGRGVPSALDQDNCPLKNHSLLAALELLLPLARTVLPLPPHKAP